MNATTNHRWESKKTDETRKVEIHLAPHFEQVDAYRYNSASIRVRVIDSRFAGKSREERDTMVEQYIEQLPERIQGDIVTLLTFAPAELESNSDTLTEKLLNREFDEPSLSRL